MGSMKDQLGDEPFDPERLRAAAASRAAKDEGMSRAAAHAAPGWADRMYECVEEVCRHAPRFTADDVFDLADRRSIDMTHDLRAFGPVMAKAARSNLCRRADCAAVPSRRESLHGSPRAVWESLTFERVGEKR